MSETPTRGVGEPVDAPEDVKASESVGYAIFDRTIGQYVTAPGDHKGKPSEEDAAKAVPDGHVAAVVRV